MLIICDSENLPLAISENGIFDPPVKLAPGNYVVRGEGIWDIEITAEVEITNLKEV